MEQKQVLGPSDTAGMGTALQGQAGLHLSEHGEVDVGSGGVAQVSQPRNQWIDCVQFVLGAFPGRPGTFCLLRAVPEQVGVAEIADVASYHVVFEIQVSTDPAHVGGSRHRPHESFHQGSGAGLAELGRRESVAEHDVEDVVDEPRRHRFTGAGRRHGNRESAVHQIGLPGEHQIVQPRQQIGVCSTGRLSPQVGEVDSGKVRQVGSQQPREAPEPQRQQGAVAMVDASASAGEHACGRGQARRVRPGQHHGGHRELGVVVPQPLDLRRPVTGRPGDLIEQPPPCRANRYRWQRGVLDDRPQVLRRPHVRRDPHDRLRWRPASDQIDDGLLHGHRLAHPVRSPQQVETPVDQPVQTW